MLDSLLSILNDIRITFYSDDIESIMLGKKMREITLAAMRIKSRMGKPLQLQYLR
jgi:hypothetical protein